jgi:hypothetical protein
MVLPPALVRNNGLKGPPEIRVIPFGPGADEAEKKIGPRHELLRCV